MDEIAGLGTYWIKEAQRIKSESDKLKDEIERIKEDYSLLARQYDDVENSCVRYYNEVKQLKSELEQSVRLPFTNADKIRFMSDEELAKFLSETHDEEIGKFLGDITICDNNVKSIYEWLKSEVEE